MESDELGDVFRRYGYDPADPVPRDAEGERVMPLKLLRALASAPVIPEREIDRGITGPAARGLERRRRRLA